MQDARLGHLYRFLWVWAYDSALELEGPHLRLQGPALNCATLSVTPGVYPNPVPCSRMLRAGFSCMRVKERLGGNRLSPWMVTTTDLVHPPVSQALDSIPTKKCADGALVLPFTQCAYTFFVSSSSSSPTSAAGSLWASWGTPIPGEVILWTTTQLGAQPCVVNAERGAAETTKEEGGEATPEDNGEVARGAILTASRQGDRACALRTSRLEKIATQSRYTHNV